MNIPILISLLFLSSILNLTAKTIKVPEDYPTIQAGLNKAIQGDSILVNKGTYKENIIWPGISNLSLIGKYGSANTIIDGSSKGRTISIQSSNSSISGVTITGGLLRARDSYGAGIYCYASGLKIDSCLITKNTIDDGTADGTFCNGAGLYLLGDAFIIKNTTFSYNLNNSKSFASGGALYISYGTGEINNSKFWANDVKGTFAYGGAIYLSNANVSLNNDRFEQNGSWSNFGTGAAIYAKAGTSANALTITNCLIRQNVVTDGLFDPKSIIYAEDYNLKMTNTTLFNNYEKLKSVSFHAVQQKSNVNTFGIITNCILWGGNKVSELASSGLNNLEITYCDIKSEFSGLGNFSKDPLFADSLCHLGTNSPCFNAGHNQSAPLTDIDGNLRPLPTGTMVDLGCYEMPSSIFASTSKQFIDNRLEFAIAIFPNPSLGDNRITFKAPINEIIESYYLMNSQGVSITKEFNNLSQSISLDISHLSKGAYLAKFKLANGTETISRLIIN